jgi:hypothetical protein
MSALQNKENALVFCKSRALATPQLAKIFGFLSKLNLALQSLHDRVLAPVLVCRPIKGYFVFDFPSTRLEDHNMVGGPALVASRFAVGRWRDSSKACKEAIKARKEKGHGGRSDAEE